MRRLGAVLSVLFVAVAAAVAPGVPAQPARAYSGISVAQGFDICAAPTVAQMSTWYDFSPYWNVGIYIGGTARSCAQPNLTPQWIRDVQNVDVGGEWGILPIWVGPQSQCVQNPRIPASKRFSNLPQEAYAQGRQEALTAVVQAIAFEFDLSRLPLIYDLEAFDAQNPASGVCVDAAQAFIQGWTEYLHGETGTDFQSGVYGSACGSGLSKLADPPVPPGSAPDFIWGADISTNPSTSAMRCVPATRWADFQRHKQYVLDTTDGPWGGLSLRIDKNCSNGPVYFPFDRFDLNLECA